MKQTLMPTLVKKRKIRSTTIQHRLAMCETFTNNKGKVRYS